MKADQDQTEEEYRRISNGQIEEFNRKSKDIKRLARGYSDFDFVRNRILWAERKDTHIFGCPVSKKEIRLNSKPKTNVENIKNR